MTTKAKLGVTTVVLGAALAITGASAAGDKATPKLLRTQFAQLSGDPIRGLVVAAQRPGRRRIRVHVSLHDLPHEDGTAGRYTVLASKGPCAIDFNAGGDDADGDVDGADFLVWRTPSIIMANTEGDLHVRSARLRAPLKSAQSIRIFDRSEGGTPTQRACGRAQGWATFPSDR